MRYRVVTTAATVAKSEPTETIYEDPELASELFMRLIMLDGTVPHSTGHRLVTSLLRGDDSFTALGHTNHYTIQRVP